MFSLQGKWREFGSEEGKHKPFNDLSRNVNTNKNGTRRSNTDLEHDLKRKRSAYKQKEKTRYDIKCKRKNNSRGGREKVCPRRNELSSKLSFRTKQTNKE